MRSNLCFQYCQKLVVLSADKKSILLARRKGEADYDGVYSFIGGKMETTDSSILEAMKREKNEEIGSAVRIKVLPHETYNVLFTKKDGSSMILPHIAAVFVSGDIALSDEYSDYRWVALTDLPAFEPKIANIPALADWATTKLQTSDKDLVEI